MVARFYFIDYLRVTNFVFAFGLLSVQNSCALDRSFVLLYGSPVGGTSTSPLSPGGCRVAPRRWQRCRCHRCSAVAVQAMQLFPAACCRAILQALQEPVVVLVLASSCGPATALRQWFPHPPLPNLPLAELGPATARPATGCQNKNNRSLCRSPAGLRIGTPALERHVRSSP